MLTRTAKSIGIACPHKSRQDSDTRSIHSLTDHEAVLFAEAPATVCLFLCCDELEVMSNLVFIASALMPGISESEEKAIGQNGQTFWCAT